MTRNDISCVLMLLMAAVVIRANQDWSYFYEQELETKFGPGPLNWAKAFPKSCSGTHQSPVNVITINSAASTIVRPVSGDHNAPFVFSPGYSSIPSDMTLTNDGHTVHLTTSNTTDITFGGAGLPGKYKLAGVHFHWGSGPRRGSEHTIDKKRFPMEMHMVHVKTTYPTVDAAKSSKDPAAIAVLGVLFEETKSGTSSLAAIADSLAHVASPNSVPHNLLAKEKFSYRSLLPEDTNRFYRYFGSLTTPPCSEVVAWTIFKQRLPISSKQLVKVRGVQGDHAPMEDNFRPVQPLNGRFVRVYGPLAAAKIDADSEIHESDNEIDVD